MTKWGKNISEVIKGFNLRHVKYIDEEIDLKPCWVCGGEPRIRAYRENADSAYIYIECSDGCSSTGLYDIDEHYGDTNYTVNDVINIWNSM